MSGTPATSDPRGRTAHRPGQIPAVGWRDVLTRVKDEARTDQVSLLAAGVAFFLLLSIVPTLLAALSIYGLVADPAQVQDQIGELAGGLPGSARDLVVEQITSVAERSTTGLSISAAVSIVIALWSASSGVRHLIEALNTVYDEQDDRGPVQRYGQAVVLAAIAIVGGVVAIATLSIVPGWLDDVTGSSAAGTAASVLRWPLLAAGFAVALGALYRVGPDRDAPRVRWLSWGAAAATVMWLLASIAFSLYAAHGGSYETYGSLAGAIVLMLWLQLTATAILLGAELNCELERQTRVDSTVGPPQPQGERAAHAADTTGPTAEEVRAG
jgi:membrane protein